MGNTTIAVLLTCFNRKDKTLSCLERLYAAHQASDTNFDFKVYLTDDNSSDGTSEAVAELYPEVTILKGNGSLYWAGGMRNSWSEAQKGNYDMYLLLNDDTDIFPELFSTLFQTHKKCLEIYNQPGIYIGSTYDKESKKLSYGGARLTNKFLFKYHFIEPKDKIQECDLGNANIMMVTKEVVDEIGMLSEGYIHGVCRL